MNYRLFMIDKFNKTFYGLYLNQVNILMIKNKMEIFLSLLKPKFQVSKALKSYGKVLR